MIDDALWDEVAAMQNSPALRLRIASANVVGAVLVAVQSTVLSRPSTGADGSSSRFGRDLTISLVVSLVYIVIAGFVIDHVSSRRAARAFGWTAERRLPTEDERSLCLRFPWIQAREFAWWWLGGAALVGALQLVYDNAPAYAARTGIAVALGGLTTAAVCFLLLERANRPAFTLALAGAAPPEGVVLGLSGRFALLWALGAGVPLVIVGTAPIGLTANQRSGLTLSLVIVSAVGIVAGVILTRAGARSIVDPLTAMRAAQQQVANGVLDVEVAVDDGGDVGLLQAGFNRMVEGLRERRQLQDLFGRHVGVEVARNALAQSVTLGGELRDATVLFIDLIGSTSMTQTLSPQDVVALLNEVFGCVVRCTTAEGGWVNKFEGDAALCIFGPPAGTTDHAASALRAARALHGELVALATRHPLLDAGIGVSTGQVVAGNIGSEDRYEYTVIGDPVNEAARLTESAKAVPQRVLASGDSLAAADATERGKWRPHGVLDLRGRSTPTEAFAPA